MKKTDRRNEIIISIILNKKYDNIHELLADINKEYKISRPQLYKVLDELGIEHNGKYYGMSTNSQVEYLGTQLKSIPFIRQTSAIINFETMYIDSPDGYSKAIYNILKRAFPDEIIDYISTSNSIIILIRSKPARAKIAKRLEELSKIGMLNFVDGAFIDLEQKK